MRKRFLPLKVVVLLMAGLWTWSTAAAQTLKHSYTFEEVHAEDGALYVIDEVGGVNGLLEGDAEVVDGQLTLSGTGYVSFPANSIAINEYESVTIETFFNQAEGLSGYTTLFGVGRKGTGEDAWKGMDYFQYQPTREDNISKLAVSTLYEAEPWANESSVNAGMMTDTRTHYVVGVLTATEVTLYIDGVLIGSEPLTGTNALASIVPESAFLGWGVYGNDPKWQGNVEEFHIYDGVMTDLEVEQRFRAYMGDNYFNPLLETLSFSKGELSPVFEQEEFDYVLTVPYGTTAIDLNAETVVPSAKFVVFDGSNNELDANAPITFGEDGIALSISVTAIDGTTTVDYYVDVVWAEGTTSAALSDIELSVGNLRPAFTAEVTEYAAILPAGTTSVTVDAVPMWPDAVVSDDGVIEVTEGSAEIVITVTSADGEATQDYTLVLHVSKFALGQDFFIQHEASELVLGESQEEVNRPRLYLPLVNEATQYFQFEESGVEGQYYVRNQNDMYLSLDRPRNADGGDFWNLEFRETLPSELDSARFVIDEFEPGRFRFISVERIEENGKYMSPNSGPVVGSGVFSDKPIGDNLNVWSLKQPTELVSPYDTYLESLEIEGDTLYPLFDRSVQDYYMVLPDDATSITINATPRDETSVVSGIGEQALETSGTLIVRVASANEEESRDYRIHYQREVPLTLMHSYTFADGTARDMVGEAHGEIIGGRIENGAYISDTEGDYISLPGEVIGINTYPAFTVEMFLVAPDGVNGQTNTMFAWFGATNPDNNYGVDGFFMHHKSRAAISTANQGDPWATEDGVNSILMDDGMPHHMVATVTMDSLVLFVDGVKIGSVGLRNANKIFNLSNADAFLAKGGYANDATWKGTILEYNIYAGEIDEATVMQRYTNFPLEDGSADASLSELMVDGEILEGFSPYTYNYVVEVVEGAEPFVTAVATNPEAEVVVAQAEEFPGEAIITVTSADGSAEVVYTVVFEGITTSFIEPKVDEVTVYPTVGSGSFTIDAKGANGRFAIFSLNGTLVKQGVLNGSSVEVNLTVNGVYLVRVETASGLQVVKIVKR